MKLTVGTRRASLLSKPLSPVKARTLLPGNNGRHPTNILACVRQKSSTAWPKFEGNSPFPVQASDVIVAGHPFQPLVAMRLLYL